MLNLRAAAVLLLTACGTDVTQLDAVICAEPEEVYIPPYVGPEVNHHAEAIAPSLGDYPPVALFPESLVLNPEPAFVPYVRESARRYWDMFGLQIDIDPSGIPFTQVDSVTANDGTIADAVAHYDRACSFSSCDASKAYIHVAGWMLTEKQWAMQQTSDHEIGHIVSGWGIPSKMPIHIERMHGVMSPGCENHVCAPWSDEDAVLICGGAPCTRMEIPDADTDGTN